MALAVVVNTNSVASTSRIKNYMRGSDKGDHASEVYAFGFYGSYCPWCDRGPKYPEHDRTIQKIIHTNASTGHATLNLLGRYYTPNMPSKTTEYPSYLAESTEIAGQVCFFSTIVVNAHIKRRNTYSQDMSNCSSCHCARILYQIHSNIQLCSRRKRRCAPRLALAPGLKPAAPSLRLRLK